MSYKGNNEFRIPTPDAWLFAQLLTKVAESIENKKLFRRLLSTTCLKMKRITLATIYLLFAIVAVGQTKQKTTDSAKNTAAPSTTSFRMHFDDIFKRNADNTVSPILPLEINGEMVGTSTKIVGGTKYGGLDISYYTGHDALVDTLKGVVIIRQFLK